MNKYVYMCVIIKGFIRFDDRRLLSPTVVICWIEADRTVTASFKTPEAPEKSSVKAWGLWRAISVAEEVGVCCS